MKIIILVIFFITASLKAQIYFYPEFGLYKLHPNDQLKNISLFYSGNSGEFFYTGYFNQPDHLTRVVKYNLEGTVVGQKVFPLSSTEEYISGKVFSSKNKIFFVSITAYTADTVLTYEPDYLDNSITTSNYLSFKVYDYENRQLLDSTRVLVGTNYAVRYIRRSLKLGKLNFMNIPFPDREPFNIYVGVKFDGLSYGGLQESWKYTSHLYKLSLSNGNRISQTIKLDNCGNDFYLNGDTIISSGYNRSVGSITWYEESIQYILKSDNEFTTSEITYKLVGNRDKTQYGFAFKNYIQYFEGLFNNFPESSEYSPLSWYSGLDSYDPKWEGPYFILRSKDFSTIRTSVFGAFSPETMHNAHTYIKLNYSSDALLYFTKDGDIITYLVRRVSDGKLMYYDSYGTLLPDYILKSGSGKQYYLRNEPSGLTAYVLKGEIATGVDESDYVLPGDYELWQNYPNPFNSTTKIKYVIPQQSYVEFKIIDMLGKEVTTLVSEVQQPGEYIVDFDSGSLPSGIYIYAIHAGNFRSARKLILMK